MSKTPLKLECAQNKLGVKGTIAFIILADMFIPLSTDMYLPALPTMSEHLNTNASLVNITVTAFFVAYALGMLFWGPLSDKFGRRRMLLVGFGVYLAGSALCAAAPNIEVLIAARMLHGIGAASVTAISMAIVKDCFSGRIREQVLAIVQTLSGIGPIMAPVLGGWVLLITDWRGVFELLFAFGVVGFILTLLFEESLPVSGRYKGSFWRVFGQLGVVLKNKSFFWVTLIFALHMLPIYAYIVLSSYIYVDGFGTTEQVYSYFYASAALISMIAPYLYIKCFADFSKKRFLTVCFTFLLISGLAVLTIGQFSPWLFSGSFLIFFFASNLFRPLSTNVILEQQEHDIGSASSVMNMSFNFSGCLGMLLGSLPMHNSILLLGGAMAVCSLLEVVLWLWLMRSPIAVKGVK